MAVAEVKRRLRPLPPPPVEEVVLRLSEEEALFLCALLGSIPSYRPGQSVYNALHKGGLGYDHERYAEMVAAVSREVLAFVS